MLRMKTIFIVLSLTIFLAGCNVVESEPLPDQIIQLMAENKLEEARTKIQKIKDPNADIDVLRNYLFAKIELTKMSSPTSYDSFANVRTYLSNIPKDYKGNLQDKLNEFKKELFIIMRPFEQNEITHLIKQEEYLEVTDMIDNSLFKEFDPSYQVVRNFINAISEKGTKRRELLFSLPSEYKGFLSDDILRYQEEDLEYLAQLIVEGKYALAGIETRIFEIDKIPNETLNVLRNYAIFLADETRSRNNAIAWLAKIPLSYSGVFSEDIKRKQQKFSKEVEEFRAIYAKREALEALPKKDIPDVGMTAAEILESTWGEPIRVNKTTTANGINEQWVYSLSKYIYFENGIVIALQESN